MASDPLPAADSFRVPNSVIQGLTTATTADLNRLPAFSMTTLLGLLTLLDPKHAEKEVRARPCDILEVIEVGRRVAHAVEREWATAAGEERRKRYQAHRYHPKHLRMIHAALRALHAQTVALQRWDPNQGVKLDDRMVHLLDMFGYTYTRDGKAVDVDDLPPGSVKVNVGTPERPVWRVRRQTERGEREERPSGILFRLNAELARELTGARGTIGFTILARKIFGLLRRVSREPAAIRLLLLVLRQTAPEFRRPLNGLLKDLGFDAEHRGRAVAQLEAVLLNSKFLGVVRDYAIDAVQGLVIIAKNPDWYREEGGAGPHRDG